MPDYSALKLVHVSCVIGSYALFFIRGVWMMRQPALLERRWVRMVPHVVDTLLLASAAGLALAIHQYPFADAWLTAKILGLLVYIGLGMIALKRGRTRRGRIAAWLAAQAVFFYIAAVALTHDPQPWSH